MTQTSFRNTGTRPAARFDDAVRAAVEQGLLGERGAVVGFIDIDGVRESVAALRDAFAATPDVLHTFAAKAAS